MDILQRIIKDKKVEVQLRKNVVSQHLLEGSALMERPTSSLAKRLRESSSGIIAEHKRRSPSKSVINETSSVHEVTKGYENAGVCGMSVLTDTKYFGGSLDDLLIARSHSNLPLLRKEFIIDAYQILEARAYGADVILLIAAVLSKSEIKGLSEFAKSLDLDVLLEVHNEEELQRSLIPSIDMLGVNNRNLKTFDVSLDTSKHLSQLIPDDFVKVSESGISSVNAIKELQPFGYKGFLIGENFMKTNDPGASALSFINALES